jgi:hypothetical protein
MRTFGPRFLLVLLLAACGGEAAEPELVPLDPGDDVDGSGKEDGVSSSSDDHVLDAPFYFGVPRTAITTSIERQLYPYPTVWNPTQEVDELGLRVIAVKQTSNSVTAKKTARREMAQKLARAGVLRDGDVVLTFRPELAGTMAYPHIQMGTTHAGLVYLKDGVAYNIDSPLDSSYMGRFDAPHYAGNGGDDAGTDALHIVRPRVMNDERRRSRLVDWIGKLQRALPRINGERVQVKFQSDYLKPIYVARGTTTKQTVTTLGKIILELDTTTLLPMYCSEFAWHMIALSGCTADEIRSAPAEGADCVGEPFAPLPMVSAAAGEVGLTEGPMIALLAAPAEERETLEATIFADGDPGRLSSGHRAVAEQVAPLMPSLSQLFLARAAGANLEMTADAANMLNAPFPRNYSPTAFLVASMGADESRTVDYVVTIAFVDGAGYEKARRLAQRPVP